jgi:DNA topoisomerase-1
MADAIRAFVGDCTVETDDRTHRGRVLVLVKPDRTVLVHDTDGYQPVAWLTRADSVAVEADDGFGLIARLDDRTLRVTADRVRRSVYPVTEAGVPVGTSPDTGGPLIRTGGAVVDLDAGTRYPLVAGATVLDDRCPDCGLPRMRVDRGAAFEVCIDRACDSPDDAVRERFDREWGCPDCGSDLRIIRRNGRLLAGCDAYPDCETAFTLPAGIVVDDCPCGLPVFETATGRRCLDGTCDRR